MKKIIAVVSALVLIGCIAVVFYGCGAKDEIITTTIPSTTIVTPTQNTTMNTSINDGVVTDESEKGNNGVIGDIVTDVSEGISDMVTDVSEGVSRMVP